MSTIERALEKAANARKLEKGRETETAGQSPRDVQTKADYCQYPAAAINEVTTNNPLLATLFDPHSPITEEFRKLKSHLLGRAKEEGFNNTIVITSARDGEGKSMVAVNLAVTLAQEYDHTVLLMDVDLRRSAVTEYLGIECSRGLSDFLTDGGSLSDILYKTGIGTLTVLPAGKAMKNPVELLSSQKMKNLVAEIKGRYSDRLIIIDAPPVLPFAETRALSAMSDAVVLVVKEGATSLKLVKEAINIIGPQKVAGLVYNDADTPPLFGGRYYAA